MPVDLRLELEKISKKEDRTVTNVINMALKRYIEMYNGEKKQGREINLYPKFFIL